MKKILFILSILALVSCTAQQSPIRHATPESMGMDSKQLALIDSVVNDAVAQGIVPGAVVSVVRKDALVYLRAFGNKSVYPDTVPMTENTIFDLASVSKCVGTTLSFMQLIEDGKVRLTDPVTRFIPEYKPWENPETGKKVGITVQDLLTHSSGVDSYITVSKFVEEFGENQPDSLIHYIATRTGRHFEPGSDVLYSCLNFITLQNILQRVTGQRLCDYAQANVFDALGLKSTTYFPLYGNPQSNPNAANLAPLCAPTEVQADGQPLVAAVHDPIARLCNAGNSGNAGVFSTAEDLAAVAAAILNGGALNGRRILGSETVRLMMEIPHDNDPQVARALGWDTYAAWTGGTNGDIFNRKYTVGHTGYTGTSILMDPSTETAVIVLAHRVHPKDEGSNARMRSVIATIAAGAITESTSY